MEEVKKVYLFTDQDAENLTGIKSLMERNGDLFISKFYDFILRFKNVSNYLQNDEIIEKHKAKVKQWLIRLFEGNYNEEYLRSLYRIGEIHVKIGLPGHYVNSSMSFVRRYCHKVLTDEFGCSKQRDVIIN